MTALAVQLTAGSTIEDQLPLTPGRRPDPTLGKKYINPKQAGLIGGSVDSTRRRRERPCDACRKRKSRCVINNGAILCILCDLHKQDCTFVEPALRRKRKADSPGEKAEKLMEKRDGLSLDATARSSIKATEPSRNNPDLRKNDSYAGLDKSPRLGSSTYSRYIGATAALDSTVLGLVKTDFQQGSSVGTARLSRVSARDYFVVVSEQTAADVEFEAEANHLVEQAVHPHGPALIDLFFHMVNPSFPIVEQASFLYRHSVPGSKPEPALLAAMYCLALNWWSSDSRLATLQKPDADRLEEIAYQTLRHALDRPRLSTVQAGLLLLQRPVADLWPFTVRLIAVSQELGVHLDCSNWDVPLWEKSTRKKLAWALYLQDKWTSLAFGYPSHIFAPNWAAEPLGEGKSGGVDAPKVFVQAGVTHRAVTGSQTADGSLFGQMTALTGIMSEVLDTFYTQSAITEVIDAGKGATRFILERAKPVQMKLKNWFASLPPSMRMNSSDGSVPLSAGVLHLAYFATEITLHRRIISSLPADLASDFSPHLTHICRSAAKTRLISAMQFVNRLTPEHLSAMWYFPSAANFALIGTFGALLMATAPGAEEAEFYEARLREYRWTLAVSVERAPWLREALESLDQNLALLKGLGEKPSVGNVKLDFAEQWDLNMVTDEQELLGLTRFTPGLRFEGLVDEQDDYGSDEGA